MQVSEPNNVKIYNLSAGKSLPEWLSERKRRALLKKDVDLRRRIELIQDFDMPGVSTTVKVSNDGQYILATGIYKPRVKCFDVNNLSLKFERCFDAEAVTFEILSDDYSKLAILQCDRYIEFHAAFGKYYRLRVPRYGRDMKYHYPSCDLFVVGVSPEIYRLNLERGQFMAPYQSSASVINKCAINPVHQLLICGTKEGTVEAFDPRNGSKVGTLDCALRCMNEIKELEGFPSVTALQFDGAFQLGVGTATGQIMLYDIRSDKPFYIKDHMYGLPIKDIEYHHQQELIYSMDSSILKIWDKNNGKAYTSIEASKTEFNNLCVLPNTGLMFIANESTKIQTYYIPSLGPAPKWASFLDSLTEELEESNAENVYDDYKFVTKQELESLGLEDLIGTNLLRAYMHGYFMDIRLYRKAKAVADPFEFDNYRKKKIRETIEKDRTNRVQLNNLPKVNRELALKLMTEKDAKKKNQTDLLGDQRFKRMFENPDFEIDVNSETYRLINPVMQKVNKVKKKKVEDDTEKEETVELEGKNSSEESSDSLDEDYSSDDEDRLWVKDLKKTHKAINREKRQDERTAAQEPKLVELQQEEFKGIHSINRKQNKATLGERIQNETTVSYSSGNREMVFPAYKKRMSQSMAERNKLHKEERKKIVRPVNNIKFSNKFGGKRKR